jgi:uncharacterized ubiquitin-like protein YukD
MIFSQHTSEKIKKRYLSFIENASKLHNGKYDYNMVNYINSKTKVKIICKHHGEFEMIPNSHSMGSGCPKCSGFSYSKEEYIKQMKLIYGETYDYSKINYKFVSDKVEIICKIHGSFYKQMSRFLGGAGCQKCLGFGKSNKDFISQCTKIHGNKFDYSLTKYNKARDFIDVICKSHGIFKIKAYCHLNGVGCVKCYGNKLKTTEEFVADAIKIHGSKYDYSLVLYKGSKSLVDIICPVHGIIKQTPNNHLSGQNCVKCTNKVSKRANAWLDSIHNDNIIREYTLPQNKKRKVDGYDSTTNTVYQFHGSYYHGDPRAFNSCDLNKKLGKRFIELYTDTTIKDFQLLCWGYNLIVMWEYDWIKK